jgi:hypothetical protein
LFRVGPFGELCDFWWVFSITFSGIAKRDDFDVASTADIIVMGSWFSLAIDQLLK